MRAHATDLAVVVVPRLVAGLTGFAARPPLGELWGDTELVLPDVAVGARLVDRFTAVEVNVERAAGGGVLRLASVLCLACDLPYVTSGLIARVASEAPEASACAPRPEGLWQPLCARYGVRASLPVARAALDADKLSLQRILSALGAYELPLSADELHALRDWDSPEDVLR